MDKTQNAVRNEPHCSCNSRLVPFAGAYRILRADFHLYLEFNS
jgi:hypothetical protein